MGIYPDASGGSIGALLRQIQDERQNNPAATPPNTEVGNPVRDLTQPALSAVESPESAHVFATRPELTPGQPGQGAPLGEGTVVPPVAPEPSASAGVVAPAGPAGNPSAPAAPSAPSPAPSSPMKTATLGLASHVGAPTGNTQVFGPTRPVGGTLVLPASQNKSVAGNVLAAATGAGAAGVKAAPTLLNLASKVVPSLQTAAKVAGKASSVLGGFNLANFITDKLGIGSFAHPKKAS